VDDGDAYTNTKSFPVTPGSYTVRRNNPASWFTTAISCTPDGKATIDLPERRAAITVAAGDTVTCTYTVTRGVKITARAFNDLMRRGTNLGKRNGGDPWQTGWNMSVAITPTAPIATGVTGGSGAIPQASFINLRPGSYVVCTTLPAGSWTPTTPTANDPVYGQPCKTITLTAGQSATLLFGAYAATVVASENVAPEDELITDEDTIGERPYDPAEDETATAEEGAQRLFLPLINR